MGILWHKQKDNGVVVFINRERNFVSCALNSETLLNDVNPKFIDGCSSSMVERVAVVTSCKEEASRSRQNRVRFSTTALFHR